MSVEVYLADGLLFSGAKQQKVSCAMDLQIVHQATFWGTLEAWLWP